MGRNYGLAVMRKKIANVAKIDRIPKRGGVPGLPPLSKEKKWKRENLPPSYNPEEHGR